MAQRLKTDWTLFGTTICMAAFGVVILYSASSVIAELKFGSSWHFAMQERRHAGRVMVDAGGVGAARFLDGLTRVIEPERIFIIGNTADDAEIHERDAGARQLFQRRVGFLVFAEDGDDGFILKHRLLHGITERARWWLHG